MTDHILNISNIGKINKPSMNTQPTFKSYNKPPIVEALIDIQVQPSDDIQNTTLEKLYEKIKSNYPNKENIFLKTAQIDISKEQTNFITNEMGLKVSSLDKKYVAQLKKTGLTFSIINAYHGWDDLYDKTKQLWTIFNDEVKPSKIIRIAVRYINRIDIPALNFDMEEYFHVCPKANLGLSGFFLQIQVPQSEGGLAIIHQTATTPIQAGFTSILLDLEIFEFQSLLPTDNKLWERVEILRIQKNNLFEKCITDKTRELFS
ncbi:MAG: TIGR04255 family protein [Gammaproteobacteria bacterium]